MSSVPLKTSLWKATFTLSTPLFIGQVKGTKEIEFITEPYNQDRRIIGTNVITPKMTLINAISYAELNCNRCIDYLSFLSDLPLYASLKQMNTLDSKTDGAGSADLSSQFFIPKKN